MPNVNINRKAILQRGPVNPSPIGVVFSNDFSASSWTTQGAGTTWTYNASSIGSVGTSSTFTSLIRYNRWFLQSESYTITANVVVNSSTASDRFLSIGIAGVSTFSQLTNYQCALYAQSGATKGYTEIYYWNGTSVANSGASRLSFSVGDTIEYTVTYNSNTVTFSVRNLTTLSAFQTISYTNTTGLVYPGASLTNFPNINQIAINNYYGDYTITNITYSDNQYKNVFLTLIGDSKSEGYYADTMANRIISILDYRLPNICQVAAGSGNTTQDILNSLPEVLAQRPRYVILYIGCNDLRNGVLNATWQANYASIVSQLEAIGTIVYHQLPTPETVLVQTDLTNYINSTYSASKIISVPAGWSNAIHLNADGIHLSILGNQLMADNIMSVAAFNPGSYYPPYQSTLQSWYDSLSVKPSSSLMIALNGLMQGIENDGDLAEIDFIHPIGGLETDEQRLAPIKTTGTTPMTAVNSPTLSSNGVVGNGTTSYINTNWNPVSNAVKYLQNTSSLGVYNRTTRAADTTAICGAYTLAPNKLSRIYPRYTGNLAIFSLNSSAESTFSNSVTKGFISSKRTASNLTTLYIDGVSIGTDSDVSAVAPNASFFICGISNSGVLADATTDNVALLVVGGNINHTRLYNRIQTYMTARGINV